MRDLLDKLRENFPAILEYFGEVLLVFLIFLVPYLLVKKLLFNNILKENKSIIDKFNKELGLLMIALFILLSLWIPLSFQEFPEFLSNTINKILSILVIFILTGIAIKIVRLVKKILLSKYDIDEKNNLKARKVYTQFNIIERVLVFTILLIAISLALMTFSEIRRIGVSLIASAGLTGIILGLAAQKILGGILAGIQIAITQPIRYDDVVIVENEWGKIEEINLTYVVVKIWDERRLVLPTTYFIEKPFQNWTRTNSDILGTVFIYTDYKISFDAIREEQNRLLEETDLWDGKVNVVQVTNTTEKSVEIRCLVSAEDSSKAWDLRVYLREYLIKFIQENYPESLPKTRVVVEEKNGILGKK